MSVKLSGLTLVGSIKMGGVGGPPVDPLAQGSILFLFNDQPNGSTAFTNTGTIATTVTRTGSATITTNSPISGNGSLSLPNATSYISSTVTPFTPSGATPFTIECSVNLTNITDNWAPILFSDGGNGFYYTPFYKYSGLLYSGDGKQINNMAVSLSWANNTTYHLCTSYDGTTYRMYRNGTKVGQTTLGVNGGNHPNMHVGGGPGYPGCVGKVDNVRFTPGVARYTTDTYTVPF